MGGFACQKRGCAGNATKSVKSLISGMTGGYRRRKCRLVVFAKCRTNVRKLKSVKKENKEERIC